MHSLKKHQLLRKRSEFDRFFKSAKPFDGKYIRLYINKQAEDIQKVAFICGKYIGNAVTRNYCKRQLREVYRKNQDLWDTNIDIAFISKKNFRNTNQNIIKNEIITLLKKHEIYTHKTN